MIVARQVPIAPDPIAVARRLASAGGRCLALLHSAEPGEGSLGGLGGGRWSFVAADPDRASALLDPLADDPDLPAIPDTGPLAFVPRWIGVLPYEARRALERPAWSGPDARAPALISDPVWHRYPAVACIDHRDGRVLAAGCGIEAVERLASILRGPVPPAGPAIRVDVEDAEPPARHAERIARALELIRRGDLYQVNLARRLVVHLRAGDPLALYASLVRRAPTPFGAFLAIDGVDVLSTSPELLLRAEPAAGGSFGALFTAPIKGTRPRGQDAALDAALARELDLDPKERAELTMIVDVERNDLGRVAETGSVRLLSGPRVTTHRTVHHRTALIAARARAGVARADVIAAMVPSGSVTGAPKVRAMEVIAALEPARRGLYTGAIGFVAHDGGVTLAMAIRTAVLRDGLGEYWTGGGIVADSDPAREVDETRWKALQILRAAGGG